MWISNMAQNRLRTPIFYEKFSNLRELIHQVTYRLKHLF